MKVTSRLTLLVSRIVLRSSCLDSCYGCVKTIHEQEVKRQTPPVRFLFRVKVEKHKLTPMYKYELMRLVGRQDHGFARQEKNAKDYYPAGVSIEGPQSLSQRSTGREICSQNRMIQQLCNSTGIVSFQVLFKSHQQANKPDCTI